MNRGIAIILTMAILLIRVNVIHANELDLNAKSAVLIDADTGRVLYEKNSNNKMPMASTTKIMTCIIVLENGNLEDEVKVSPYAASMPKVKLGITTKDAYRLGDLLYSLMLESHNDVAVAIAEHIAGSVEEFAKLMNQKATEIGAYNTNFVTPNGLDDDGHYSTAYDMALIGAYAINNEKFLEITNTKTYSFSSINNNKSYTVYNRDGFLTQMQGAIGIKTGFTGKAGYCFVGAVSDNNKRFVSCVLACGWPPNKTYKWKDTLKLMNYGVNNYETKNIVSPMFNYKSIKIRQGVTDTISTYIDDDISVLLSEKDTVSFLTTINEDIAPIEKNQVIGYESIYVNDTLLTKIEIKSMETVEKYDYLYCLKLVLEEIIP